MCRAEKNRRKRDFLQRLDSIVDVDISVEIGGKNKPQHIGQKEPRCDSLATCRIDDIGEDRNIECEDYNQAQKRTSQGEETGTPQEVKQKLQKPQSQHTHIALDEHRTCRNTDQQIEHTPRNRKDYCRRCCGRLDERRIPLSERLTLNIRAERTHGKGEQDGYEIGKKLSHFGKLFPLIIAKNKPKTVRS